MNTKVNKAAIGAFVLGAIALLVAGVLMLGAGKFFVMKHAYVTYFDGSVKGLSVGSPVMFRGVKVGAVTDVSITVDPATRSLKIPVMFTLEPAKFRGTKAEFQRDPKSVEWAVAKLGLRSQLQTQSFVTGQLMVALDFFPDTPARLVGLNKKYPEVPSIPTPLEQLQKSLEGLPFREIVKNLNVTLKEIERLVGSIDARRTTQTIEDAVRDTRELIQNLNNKVGPLADGITRASGSADAALVETRETMAAIRGDIKQVLANADKTLTAAQSVLKQSEQTLQAYSDDSRVADELSRTLRDLSAATRSFRLLSDYLERHPESLLRGKAGAEGD